MSSIYPIMVLEGRDLPEMFGETQGNDRQGVRIMPKDKGGFCKDCGKWGPEGNRDRAKVGLCPEYGEMTSFETWCNKRFIPVESTNNDADVPQ